MSQPQLCTVPSTARYSVRASDHVWGLAIVSFVAAAALGIGVAALFQIPTSLEPHLINGYALPAWHNWMATVLDPNYWGFLALLLILQLIWPAERSSSRSIAGVAEDTVWFILSTVFSVTIVVGTLDALGSAYGHLTGGWSLNLTGTFGVWGLALFAFVVADLCGWVAHWLHHRVPTLWLFHSVHHSQTRMNALSDNRTHIVETLLSGIVAYIPAVLLGLNSADALKLAFATIFFSALIHANLRTTLGPLKYIFVSPQVHRVHHSVLPEHYDTNFGTVFIFWDYLFGTRHEDMTSYPPTGIVDLEFPHGRSLHPFELVSLWGRQTAYPFRVMSRGKAGYPSQPAPVSVVPAEATA